MPTWRLLQYIAILAQFTNSLPKNCGSWKQFHSGFLRFRFCAHCPAICPWHVWLWRPGTRGGALCGWGCRSLWASASTLCASGVGLELLDHAVLWETHLQLLRSPAGPKSSIAVEQWIGKKNKNWVQLQSGSELSTRLPSRSFGERDGITHEIRTHWNTSVIILFKDPFQVSPIMFFT